jgi:hypothetical protein
MARDALLGCVGARAARVTISLSLSRAGARARGDFWVAPSACECACLRTPCCVCVLRHLRFPRARPAPAACLSVDVARGMVL